MLQKLFVISILILWFDNLYSTEATSDTLKKYELPSITVTTTRAVRGESPIPFQKITAKDIQNIYTTQDIPRLLSELPSIITFSQSGNDIGYSNLTMRGFNQRRISVMINGVPQNDPEDHNVYWIDFPDLAPSIQEIQVQRGAGFNNYGSPSIGGAINLTTGFTTVEPTVKLFTGIGWQQFSYNDGIKYHPNVSKFAVEFSSGLTDNYAFYGRLARINSLGYRDHSFAFLNSYFFSAARFDQKLSTQINVFGGPINDGLVYYGLPKSFVKDLQTRKYNWSYWKYDTSGKNVKYFTPRRKQEIEEFNQPHYEILNDWKVNDNLRLLSTLFYYTGDGFFDFDGSWADTTILRITNEFGFHAERNPENAIIKAFVGNKHGGWLPRIIFEHGKNTLTAGLEIRFHRSEHWGKIKYAEYLPKDFDPDYKIYSYEGVRDIFSIFAREKFYINNNLNIFTEAQLVYNLYAIQKEKAGEKFVYFLDKNGNSVGGPNRLFEVKYLFLNPKLGMNYTFNDNLNIYIFAGYLSREPRMKELYDTEDAFTGSKPKFEATLTNEGKYLFDFSKPLVKPEKMFDIELGLNLNFFGIDGNINLYWMEYVDELVKSGKVDIFGNPVEVNVPKTRHIGVELDFRGNLIQSAYGSLSFAGNATISRNRIVEFAVQYTDDDKTFDFAGNRVSGFPDLMGNLRLKYVYKDFYISILSQYVGDFRSDYYDDMLQTNTELISYLKKKRNYYLDNKVDSYLVFHLDAGYKLRIPIIWRYVDFKFQIRNLFNRLYASGAEGKEFFPAAERNFFLGVEIGF
ncbi:MAG: TonB-dependent receptor [Candidatus Kapaibacteriales bacterium]